MKVLPLILAAALLTGCDVEKMTGIRTQEPTPAPTPAPTPKPKEKPGEWMFKNYKNPLDHPQKK
jgi:hypothetical protein